MSNKSDVEKALDTLIDLSAMSRKANEAGFDRLTKSIEELTLNVAQLAQQQKQTGANIDRLTAAIERQNQAIDGHLRLSESQSANISQLMVLATKLIDQRSAS